MPSNADSTMIPWTSSSSRKTSGRWRASSSARSARHEDRLDPLIDFLNAARAAPDAPIAFADCFTFTLSTGTVLTYTNVDQPVVYNGFTFAADGPLVQGLKYKASVGLEVDKQQITIAARPIDLINGSPFLNALRDGAMDGATVQRDRVFMSALGQTPIGGVTLFHR